MSTPYLGEIRTIGFSFAPVGWAFCNGQTLSIADNETLFSLLGTTYGGDGQTNFNLPNLQSRVVVGTGTGSGLSAYNPGQQAGTEAVSLNTSHLAPHQHGFVTTLNATTGGTPQNEPSGAYPGTAREALYAVVPTAGAYLGADAIQGSAQPVGGNQPHSNLQPVLALNYIICTDGLFPPHQ
ncbi:phage tail protein [Hymenobacter cavernae]|uniref:Microcystin dependent protein n=1 Tax=Hymenobacter cavernae TaxID=2044852 RepID=A0ABQ1TFC7_9BACT|nr:tail fiber protein [Hymenobacter cavernae]GGE93923.1 microcystin dependent protein [Hymenobacter cavernae]